MGVFPLSGPLFSSLLSAATRHSTDNLQGWLDREGQQRSGRAVMMTPQLVGD